MFKIDLKNYTINEFLNEFNWNYEMETDENIKYIKENLRDLIDNEEEHLKELVNNSENSIEIIKIIKDNRGEMIVCNEKGEDLGGIGFYTEIEL